jgi:hypothetical protein
MVQNGRCRTKDQEGVQRQPDKETKGRLVEATTQELIDHLKGE